MFPDGNLRMDPKVLRFVATSCLPRDVVPLACHFSRENGSQMGCGSPPGGATKFWCFRR